MQKEHAFARGATVKCGDAAYVVIKDPKDHAQDGDPLYTAIRTVNGRGVGEPVTLCESRLDREDR